MAEQDNTAAIASDENRSLISNSAEEPVNSDATRLDVDGFNVTSMAKESAGPEDILLCTISPDELSRTSIDVQMTFRGKVKNQTRFYVSPEIYEATQLHPDRLVILTEEDAATRETVEMLLRGIHKPAEWFQMPEHRDNFNPTMEAIINVWQLLSLLDLSARDYSRRGKFRMAPIVLKEWFAEWVRYWEGGLELAHYPSLLFPAYAFGHSKLFATTTKEVVYCSIGEIQEFIPIDSYRKMWPNQHYEDIRLPRNILRIFDEECPFCY
ncbi:hypothetical protein F4808DRAFT_462302 [Astrocystis sublimbata]|nr:hypothetical protein F4808DRAFT_462302 [Astrocystis sublimbata]